MTDSNAPEMKPEEREVFGIEGYLYIDVYDEDEDLSIKIAREFDIYFLDFTSIEESLIYLKNIAAEYVERFNIKGFEPEIYTYITFHFEWGTFTVHNLGLADSVVNGIVEEIEPELYQTWVDDYYSIFIEEV